MKKIIYIIAIVLTSNLMSQTNTDIPVLIGSVNSVEYPLEIVILKKPYDRKTVPLMQHIYDNLISDTTWQLYYNGKVTNVSKVNIYNDGDNTIINIKGTDFGFFIINKKCEVLKMSDKEFILQPDNVSKLRIYKS